MNKKFLDKYRTESTRLPKYDYSQDNFYFITICTRNRELAFGKIQNGCLTETAQSKICRTVWLDLPNHYPNCVLDAFVIMPNHIHGIISITKPAVETIHELSLRPQLSLQPQTRKQRRQMIIPKIIGRFKMQTAKQINILQNISGQPFWQRNYHDRVIRDEAELNRIREYIWNNPANWANDQNNFS